MIMAFLSFFIFLIEINCFIFAKQTSTDQTKNKNVQFLQEQKQVV